MSKWNGVPLNPERDGWHWLKEADQEKKCAFWRAKKWLGKNCGCWEIKGSEDDFVPREINNWIYLGPVAMPEETAAKDARIAQLEATLRQFFDAEMDAIVKRVIGAKVAGGKDE